MKKLIIPLITVLLSTLILTVIPTEADFAIYEDTVRLHILANSDSKEDQELKLAVRDAILTEYGKSLSVFENADNAKKELSYLLDEIKDFAREKIAELGYSYEVSATLTDEWYDTRDYEDFTLPAGTYTSLRVIIGEGEGKNWWCVMFPPLCLDVACEESGYGYTESEELLISKKYNIKFKVLELISRAYK